MLHVRVARGTTLFEERCIAADKMDYDALAGFLCPSRYIRAGIRRCASTEPSPHAEPRRSGRPIPVRLDGVEPTALCGNLNISLIWPSNARYSEPVLNISRNRHARKRFSEKSLNNSTQQRNPRFFQIPQQKQRTPESQESLIFRAFLVFQRDADHTKNLNISPIHISTRDIQILFSISREIMAETRDIGIPTSTGVDRQPGIALLQGLIEDAAIKNPRTCYTMTIPAGAVRMRMAHPPASCLCSRSAVRREELGVTGATLPRPHRLSRQTPTTTRLPDIQHQLQHTTRHQHPTKPIRRPRPIRHHTTRRKTPPHPVPPHTPPKTPPPNDHAQPATSPTNHPHHQPAPHANTTTHPNHAPNPHTTGNQAPAATPSHPHDGNTHAPPPDPAHNPPGNTPAASTPTPHHHPDPHATDTASPYTGSAHYAHTTHQPAQTTPTPSPKLLNTSTTRTHHRPHIIQPRIHITTPTKRNRVTACSPPAVWIERHTTSLPLRLGLPGHTHGHLFPRPLGKPADSDPDMRLVELQDALHRHAQRTRGYLVGGNPERTHRNLDKHRPRPADHLHIVAHQDPRQWNGRTRCTTNRRSSRPTQAYHPATHNPAQTSLAPYHELDLDGQRSRPPVHTSTPAQQPPPMASAQGVVPALSERRCIQ